MKINMSNCTITNCNIGNVGGIDQLINQRMYSAENKKINESKKVGTEGIRRIKVESDSADVTIAVSNRPNIEVHYYGEVYTNGKIKLDVTKSGEEASILVKNDGSIFNSNLKLKVLIPEKMFKLILVKCQNGSVEFCKNVEAEWLVIDSKCGRIKSEAFFKEITARSMSGSIDIFIRAKSDIEISASSMNGDISLKLENIALSNISTSCMNGTVRNMHNSNGKHKITGNISVMNGNVRVQ